MFFIPLVIIVTVGVTTCIGLSLRSKCLSPSLGGLGARDMRYCFMCNACRSVFRAALSRERGMSRYVPSSGQLDEEFQEFLLHRIESKKEVCKSVMLFTVSFIVTVVCRASYIIFTYEEHKST